MGIGAKDYIDKLLVQKYAEQKVDNHDADALVSKVDANDIMDAMNASAMQSRTYFTLNNNLAMVCYGAIAKAARYTPIEDNAA